MGPIPKARALQETWGLPAEQFHVVLRSVHHGDGRAVSTGPGDAEFETAHLVVALAPFWTETRRQIWLCPNLESQILAQVTRLACATLT